MKNNKPRIIVKNLSKEFIVPHEKHTSLKSTLLNIHKKRTYETFKVLNDLSFEIYDGEFFGILGRNGSGKSTLLKLIAGIYKPTSGEVIINGRMATFIELGVGFNPELTGRENIFLNGAILGLTQKEIERKYNEIVAFAELEKFIDQKLKNYSSGMQVRLAFSVAIQAHTEILIIDEVLAVGDASFQKKCQDYFSEQKKNKKTIVFVSHDMSAVQRFCSRAMLIEEGRIVKVSNSAEISGLYQELFIPKELKATSVEQEQRKTSSQNGLTVDRLTIIQNERATTSIRALQPFDIIIDIKATSEVEYANVGINIINQQGQILLATNTLKHVGHIHIKKGKNRIVFSILDNVYTNDTYTCNVAIVDEAKKGSNLLYQQFNLKGFAIRDIKYHQHSLTHPRVKVRAEN